MNNQHITVGDSGRFVIPASIRKDLNIKSGDKLMIKIKDGEMRIFDPKKSIEKIREKAMKMKKPGVNMVDEFLKFRKEEWGI